MGLLSRNRSRASPTIRAFTSPLAVNGKAVYPHWEKFKDGVASVLFTVPKLAAGKTLTVPVTIKLGTETTRQVETFQVG